jgi:hypothetical protein
MSDDTSTRISPSLVELSSGPDVEGLTEDFQDRVWVLGKIKD